MKSLSDETRKATDQIGATLKSLHSKLEQFVAQIGAARKSIEHARSQADSISVAVNNAPYVEAAAEVAIEAPVAGPAASAAPAAPSAAPPPATWKPRANNCCT